MAFKQSELEKQELYDYIDDKKLKKKVPIFDGTKGIESLLFLQEQYLKACVPLQFNEDERFDKFEECLTDGAEEHWTNVEPGHNRDNDGFEEALRAFYLHYSTPDARDVMKNVLESFCKKPADTTCREHQNRFETMVRRANMLHGFGNPITSFDAKNWYFQSYPEGWQNDWNTGGRMVRDASTSMNTITEYMENRKGYYDSRKEDKKRKDKKDTNKKNTYKGKKGGKFDWKKGKKKEGELCRKHNGEHLWIDCPSNRFGRNYQGDKSNQKNKYNKNSNGYQGWKNNNNKNSNSGTSEQKFDGFHVQQQQGATVPPNTGSTASSVTFQQPDVHYFDRLNEYYHCKEAHE
jgi:hypothetical protein